MKIIIIHRTSSRSIFASKSEIELRKIRESTSNLLETSPRKQLSWLYTPQNEGNRFLNIEKELILSPNSSSKNLSIKDLIVPIFE